MFLSNDLDWLSKLSCENGRDWLFTEVFHSTTNAKFLLEVLMREIIPVVSEKLSLRTEVHILGKIVFILSDDQVSEAVIETTAFSVRTYQKMYSFLFGTSLDIINFVVPGSKMSITELKQYQLQLLVFTDYWKQIKGSKQTVFKVNSLR